MLKNGFFNCFSCLLADFHKSRRGRIVIRCSLITQSLVWYEECTFGELFQSTATTCRDYLSYTITNQPIKYLCGCCRTNGCLTKHNVLTLVFGDVNGIMLRCTLKSGYLFGITFTGIFIYVSTKKCEHTFLG